MKKLFGIFVAAGLCGGAAQAETAPRALKADERIRTVAFEKDNVVFLAGTMGVSTMIVFDDEETIATVAMGDSLSWQAVPDQSKHYLFIKPLERDAVTNMNVVTTKRIYNFVLRAGRPGGPGAVYKLRFVYPDKEEDARLLAKAKEMAAMPNLAALKQHPEDVFSLHRRRAGHFPRYAGPGGNADQLPTRGRDHRRRSSRGAMDAAQWR